MKNESFSRALIEFGAAKSKVELQLQQQYHYLQQKAERNEVSDAYLRRMNDLLGSMFNYIEASERLVGSGIETGNLSGLCDWKIEAIRLIAHLPAEDSVIIVPIN